MNRFSGTPAQPITSYVQVKSLGGLSELGWNVDSWSPLIEYQLQYKRQQVSSFSSHVRGGVQKVQKLTRVLEISIPLQSVLLGTRHTSPSGTTIVEIIAGTPLWEQNLAGPHCILHYIFT